MQFSARFNRFNLKSNKSKINNIIEKKSEDEDEE